MFTARTCLAMGKKHNISETRKPVVKALTDDGKSQTDITRQIDCSQSTVSHILKELHSGHSVASCRNNSARKQITTSRDDRKLAYIAKNSFQSSKNIVWCVL